MRTWVLAPEPMCENNQTDRQSSVVEHSYNPRAGELEGGRYQGLTGPTWLVPGQQEPLLTLPHPTKTTNQKVRAWGRHLRVTPVTDTHPHAGSPHTHNNNKGRSWFICLLVGTLPKNMVRQRSTHNQIGRIQKVPLGYFSWGYRSQIRRKTSWTQSGEFAFWCNLLSSQIHPLYIIGASRRRHVDSTHLDNTESTGHAQIGKFLNNLLTLLQMAFKTETLLISAAHAK